MGRLNKALARFALTCWVAIAAPGAVAASAAGWPTKPVRLIVPFSPGGGTDIIARTLGQKLSETFGQQFIVDNRPGGGGTIGAETTVKAAPDGYTMCLVSASYAANPALYRLPYDPVNGIAPISLLAVGTFIGNSSFLLKSNDFKNSMTPTAPKPQNVNYVYT